jgi:hypothetical protein
MQVAAKKRASGLQVAISKTTCIKIYPLKIVVHGREIPIFAFSEFWQLIHESTPY